MTHLVSSIEKTVSYAAFFKFPVSTEDIYMWLISPRRTSLSKIAQVNSNKFTSKDRNYRNSLNLISQRKIDESINIIKRLAKIPTIRLISVTGSVAVNNSKEDDDVDLMIVTKNNSLWLTRLLITVIIYFSGRKRKPNASRTQSSDTLCLNLWLEERSLTIPVSKRSLYTAHEVLQTLPVYDSGGCYQKFVTKNHWVKRHLANAYYNKTRNLKHSDNSSKTIAVNHLLRFLNNLSYLLQYMYMKPKITTESISIKSAYFHKINFSKKINDYLEAK